MNRNVKPSVLGIAFALVWPCMVFGGTSPAHETIGPPVTSVLPAVAQVNRVTHRIGYGNSTVFVVADPDSVSSLVGQLEFWDKEPCRCAHIEELWLDTSEHQSRFSICSHCLDLMNPDGPPLRFKMPRDLWENLQTLCANGDSLCVK